MVLGITRARPRPVGRTALAAPFNWLETAAGDEWAAERGPIRFQAHVAVTGGYPGFTQRGFSLNNVQLRVSDCYLLIDEGNPCGFGLPVQWLDGAAIVARPGREAPALRIFYRDGAAARHFTVRFRGGLRSLRRGCDAERLRQLLLDLGLPDRPEDRDPSAPDIRVPWEETRRFERENVIWRGAATAPILVGEDTVPADVWLTTRSIIWGASDGDGINRLPFDVVSDVVTGQENSRAAPPAVYLAFLDTAIGRVRFELPFVFDQYSAERNLRERGAFLVGLRSRGVALGFPAPLIQPWRRSTQPTGTFAGRSQSFPSADGEDDAQLATAMAHRCRHLLGGLARQMPSPSEFTRAGQRRLSEFSHEPPNEEEWWPRSPDVSQEHREPLGPQDSDVVLAEFSAPTEIELPAWTVASTDIALASEWYEPVEDGTAECAAEAPPVPEVDLAETDVPVIGDSLRLDCARAYEAAHLSLLSEALIAIRDRIAGLPSRPLRGSMPAQAVEREAFAEFRAAERAGQMTHEEAEMRKLRLSAISEATRRLRSLVELRDAGHLTDAELALKRAEISEELSDLILAGSAFADTRIRNR
jgi:hypothetical protein